MYIIYTEIHNEGKVERWFYGLYESRKEANEVALDLDGKWPIYYCVCKYSEAKELGIQNIPGYALKLGREYNE